MWRKPNRPSHEVTQSFNDGIVKIYGVEDISTPGYAPKPKLKEKVVLRYEKRVTGYNRYYVAKQANVQIDRTIRCPRLDSVTVLDVARTEDGEQYIIQRVQPVMDAYPASMDLSLSKVVQDDEVV